MAAVLQADRLEREGSSPLVLNYAANKQMWTSCTREGNYSSKRRNQKNITSVHVAIISDLVACSESLSDDSRAEELQGWIATWCGHLVQDPSGCAFISLCRFAVETYPLLRRNGTDDKTFAIHVRRTVWVYL